MVSSKFTENGKIISHFKTFWYINSKCNYSCSYCINNFARDFSGENKLIPEVKIEQTCKNILSINADTYEFVLLGGEPTIYPDLPGVIKILKKNFKERLIIVDITTNGSRDVNYFKKFEDFKDFLIIRISIHMEYFNSRLFTLVQDLIKMGFNVSCDVMFDKNRTELVKSVCDFLLSNNISGRVRKIIKNSSYCSTARSKKFFYDYTEEDLNFVAETTKKMYGVEKKEKNIRCGNYCIVGSDKLVLDENGIISRSCSRYGGKDVNNKSIFYLTPEKFKRHFFIVGRCPYSKNEGIYLEPVNNNPKKTLEDTLERIICQK